MNEWMNECVNEWTNAHDTQPTHDDPTLKFRPQVSRDLLLLEIISGLMAPLLHWLLAPCPGQWAAGVIGLVETRFSMGAVKAALPNEKQYGDLIQETSPVGNTLVKETDK